MTQKSVPRTPFLSLPIPQSAPTATIGTAMDPHESIALIKANLAEVLNGEMIDHVILTEKRPLKVYWGIATTGRPRCGYLQDR